MSRLPRSARRTVAAVAVIRDGLVLVGRRIGPATARGGWEFPGGGVEPGETAEQAAIREAREELDIDVELTGHLGTVPIRRGLHLIVFAARLARGEPISTGSHDALRWIGPDQLHDLAWLPADRPLLEPLARLLRPTDPSAPRSAQRETGTDSPDEGPGLPSTRGESDRPEERRRTTTEAGKSEYSVTIESHHTRTWPGSPSRDVR